jgi:Holliday junction resolvasome RuvABC endonuclease subunit
MHKTIKIIGINPGTRYMGFAVFHGSELRDWGIKNIEGRWSKDKLRKAMVIISDMIGQNESNIISIKRLHPSRSPHNLNQLVAKIKELSKRKRLKIYQYSIDDLKAFFHSERINKRQLAEMVTSDYPVLHYELEKEKAIINPYYVRMFEAVALGSICLNYLDRRR